MVIRTVSLSIAGRACQGLVASLVVSAAGAAEGTAPLGDTAGPPGLSTSFANGSHRGNAPMWLMFPVAPEVKEGQFAVIIGQEDVTAQCRWVVPVRLECTFSALPLRAGAHDLVVYRLGRGNEWTPIARTALHVVAPPAAAVAQVKPNLIVGAKSQLAESHSANAQPPDRSTYTDATLQAGWETRHGGEGWSIESQANVVGSSHRPEALTFSTLGNDAPKVDLATYRVQVLITEGERNTTLTAGQVQVGDHPLLANGLSQRGLVLAHRVGERFDISASVQNGSEVVGARNLLGLADAGHRMSTLAGHVELMDRPGGLRLGTTVFDGAVRSAPGLGVATLQDDERSRGWGLQLRSQSAGGRVRADLAYARSRYAALGQSGQSVVAPPVVEGDSWMLRMEADLLRTAPIAGGRELNLSVDAQHDRASAQYKSLGALGAAGNQVQHAVGLTAGFGVVSSRMQWSRRRDNVDLDLAFPRGIAETVSLTVGAPIGQLFDSAQPPAWAPTVVYDFNRSHSLADPGHVPTGQSHADLPDAMVTSHGLNLSWMIDRLSLGWRWSRTLQDNRQSGFEANDMAGRGQGLTASYSLSEAISISGGLDMQRSAQLASGETTRNAAAQCSLSWAFGDRYAFSANLSSSRTRDTQHIADSDTRQAQWQLVKQFDLQGFGLKLPAQWSIRYSDSRAESPGVVVRYQQWNASLALSFF